MQLNERKYVIQMCDYVNYLDNNTEIKFLKFCLSISKLFHKIALTKDLYKTLNIRLDSIQHG